MPTISLTPSWNLLPVPLGKYRLKSRVVFQVGIGVGTNRPDMDSGDSIETVYRDQPRGTEVNKTEENVWARSKNSDSTLNSSNAELEILPLGQE